MNKIEKLLAELCPDGVEFRELEEVFYLKNGYTPSTRNDEFWANGVVPWFRMEDIRENGRILNKALQNVTESAVKGGKLFPANSIIMATSATIGEHALITVPFLSNQRFTCLSVKPEFAKKLNMMFAFFYAFILGDWCKKNTTISSFSSVDMLGFRKQKIPIPPLEIQEKIVKVLDIFTQLNAALNAALNAELNLRRQQYEYYRNALLNFEDGWQALSSSLGNALAKACPNGVEYRSFGDIGEFLRGGGFQKKDFVDEGVGCIHYGQVYTHYGTFANETKTYVSETIASKSRKAKQGDVVIASTSENVEDVCKAVAWLGENEIAVSGDAFIFRHQQNPKYIAYLFQTKAFLDFKKKYATGTKVTRVSSDNLRKYLIPVPPLEIQQMVVDILDKFDALVNDLSKGLPAEIEARRQQYEYYRNKLLTFKEL